MANQILNPNALNKLPKTPGVYFFYDNKNQLLYIGKAYDLKKRVKQHFERPHDARIEQMIGVVAQVKVQKTASNIEALILESELVNSLKPKYNIKLRDDKTFLGVFITNEQFPRVFPARITKKRLPMGEFYGPFTSAKTLRQALKIIRKIFPYCTNPTRRRPCLYYYLKQCPGPCAGVISAADYRQIIGNLKLFLRGRRVQLIKQLRRDLKTLASQQHYEQAARVRDALAALEHIRDHSLTLHEGLWSHATHHDTKPLRIEGYDVSGIFGQYGYGVMVVALFDGKNLTLTNHDYRTFRIKNPNKTIRFHATHHGTKQIKGLDDVAAMAQTVDRRLNHLEWPLPELMVIDGGQGHYNAVDKILRLKAQSPKIVAVAKGPTRKKADLYFDERSLGGHWLTQLPVLKTIAIKMTTEAHRFAIKHYRKFHLRALRARPALTNLL